MGQWELGESIIIRIVINVWIYTSLALSLRYIADIKDTFTWWAAPTQERVLCLTACCHLIWANLQREKSWERRPSLSGQVLQFMYSNVLFALFRVPDTIQNVCHLASPINFPQYVCIYLYYRCVFCLYVCTYIYAFMYGICIILCMYVRVFMHVNICMHFLNVISKNFAIIIICTRRKGVDDTS